jgi:hypothetical protein
VTEIVYRADSCRFAILPLQSLHRVRAERRRRLILESDRAAFAVAAFLSFALLSFVVFSSI